MSIVCGILYCGGKSGAEWNLGAMKFEFTELAEW